MSNARSPRPLSVTQLNARAGVAAASVTLALLAGCGSDAPPKPDTAKVKDFAGRGYLPDDHYGIATSFHAWAVGDVTYELALTVPAKSGRYPLIIYLPGLGESRNAGEIWRSAWAQSGYAVLAVQPLTEDVKAWSSAEARAGDFEALARRRYSPAVMAARLASLNQVLRELTRRVDSHTAPFEQIDLTRVALAGFDIGAYTAMVAAGESLLGAQPGPLALPVTAVVALSPYADFSGAALETRYRNVHGAILSVTSEIDTDAQGLVTSPALRQAPYQGMPEGSKYLLNMSDITHRGLGGQAEEVATKRSQDHGSEPQTENAQPPGGQQGGRRHNHANAAGGADAEDAGAGGMPDDRMRTSPTTAAIGVAAIQGISIAFLDASLKQDTIAAEWLRRDAQRWLGRQGQLTRK